MMPMAELKNGMVLMDDLHLESGRLLLTKNINCWMPRCKASRTWESAA